VLQEFNVTAPAVAIDADFKKLRRFSSMAVWLKIHSNLSKKKTKKRQLLQAASKP